MLRPRRPIDAVEPIALGLERASARARRSRRRRGAPGRRGRARLLRHARRACARGHRRSGRRRRGRERSARSSASRRSAPRTPARARRPSRLARLCSRRASARSATSSARYRRSARASARARSRSSRTRAQPRADGCGEWNGAPRNAVELDRDDGLRPGVTAVTVAGPRQSSGDPPGQASRADLLGNGRDLDRRRLRSGADARRRPAPARPPPGFARGWTGRDRGSR